MMDATTSYRCKVSEGNTQGLLRLGRQRFKVDVMEMSRDSFCVRVPSCVARNVAVGSKSKLFYQGMLWSVLCTQKWLGESDRVDLELKQLDELTVPKLQKAPFFGKARSVSTIGQSDPALPVAMIGAFIIAILILPAWGGHWGTSHALCTAVSATWTALCELVVRGR